MANQETTIAREMMRSIDGAYRGLLEPILRKHDKTLSRIDKLLKAGNAPAAQRLWRNSGLLNDLAAAIAGAGEKSAHAIRGALFGIRQAVNHEA